MTKSLSNRRIPCLILVFCTLPLIAGAMACEGPGGPDPGPLSEGNAPESPPEKPPGAEPAEPRMLSIGELRQIMEVEEEQVLLVDVRFEVDFERRHAEGAVSLPLRELPERAVDELPRDVLLVTYCT